MSEVYNTEVKVSVSGASGLNNVKNNISTSADQASKLVGQMRSLATMSFGSLLSSLSSLRTVLLGNSTSFEKLENRIITYKNKIANLTKSLADQTDSKKRTSIENQILTQKGYLKNALIDGRNMVQASYFSKYAMIAAGVILLFRALAKLYSLAAETAAWAKEVKNSAIQAFMSVEGYQKWAYILDYTGTKIEKLRVAMRSMQEDNNVEFMKSLGIYTESNEQNFENAIKYIQSLGSELEKTKVATKLFGKAADDLAGIYFNSSEAIDLLAEKTKALGLIYNEETISRAARLADDINDLKSGWSALTRNLAITFMPAFENVVHELLKVVAALNSSFAKYQAVTSTIKKNVDGISDSANELKRTLAGFDELEILNPEEDSTSDSESTLTLFDEEDLKHIDDLTKALTSVVDTFKSYFSPFADDLSDFAAEFFTGDGFFSAESILQQTFGVLVNLYTQIKPLLPILNVIGTVIAIVADLLTAISASVLAVVKWVVSGFEDISGFSVPIALIADVASRAMSFVEDSSYGLIDLSDAIKDVKSWSNSISNDLSKYTEDIKKNTNDNTSNICLAIGALGVATGNPLLSVIAIAIGGIEKTVQSIANKTNGYNNGTGIITGTVNAGGNIKNTLHLKEFATGGVVYNPTIAKIGEYSGASSNPEIVTPESLLTSIIDSSNQNLAGVYAQCTRQLISAIEENRTEISIGDEQIARSAARGNTKYKQMTGFSLI